MLSNYPPFTWLTSSSVVVVSVGSLLHMLVYELGVYLSCNHNLLVYILSLKTFVCCSRKSTRTKRSRIWYHDTTKCDACFGTIKTGITCVDHNMLLNVVQDRTISKECLQDRSKMVINNHKGDRLATYDHEGIHEIRCIRYVSNTILLQYIKQL